MLLRLLAGFISLSVFAVAQTPAPAPKSNAPKAAPAKAAAKTTTKSSSAKKQNPPDWPIWVPQGAVKISDASWRVIEDGKPVYYRATPFGFAKLTKDVDDKIQRHIDGNPDDNSHLPENVQITDLGDKIRVYFPGPFGPTDYIKSKDSLNQAERAAYNKLKGEKKN